jgi:hypothetical protein
MKLTVNCKKTTNTLAVKNWYFIFIEIFFSHHFACEKQQEENGNSLDGDERHFLWRKEENPGAPATTLCSYFTTPFLT